MIIIITIIIICHLFHEFATYNTAITCNNNFESGGWALVRRVKKGSSWHPATDNLRGMAFYGIRNSKMTEGSVFSIPYANILWDGTEMLFTFGSLLWCILCIHLRCVAVVHLMYSLAVRCCGASYAWPNGRMCHNRWLKDLCYFTLVCSLRPCSLDKRLKLPWIPLHW